MWLELNILNEVIVYNQVFLWNLYDLVIVFLLNQNSTKKTLTFLN